MILGELRGPFIFGVALFSLLTIATVVLQDALRFISKWDLPASMFFTLVGYAMPQFIVLSIPMGVLLGTLLSVGRLNSDQEIVALRACGISLYRILMPFFLVGVFLAGLTFLSNEAVVPYCNSRLKDIKNEVISGKTGQNSMQRMSWEIYDHGELRWVLVANEVVGTTLNDVLMLYFDPVDKYSNFMVEAERAEWDSSSWTLFNLRQVMLHRGQEEDEPLVTHAEKLTLDDFNILPESLAHR
jgi:lipopolysaccharide export system permease protein